MSNKKTYEIVTDVISILNNYLNDPYVIAGGTARNWVHRDTPLGQATYPRIQVVKGSKENDIISLGYSKKRTLLLNIFFYTRKGFKVVIDGTSYTNENLVEYCLEEIEDTLDTYRDSISSTWGLKVSTSNEPIYIPDENNYIGMLTVRIFYFRI